MKIGSVNQKILAKKPKKVDHFSENPIC